MMSWQEARAIVLAYTPQLGTEIVPLDALYGRVLAQPLIADHDLPRFDCSSVDGFAVRAEDITANGKLSLPITGTIRAGAESLLEI